MMHGRPIAVLPFENRSREADDAFFVDGIHDDILTQLSKVSALRVISRTSVEQFRDTKLPMKAIADQLGVTKILEGGVQRAGDRVRINVQLIDASDRRAPVGGELRPGTHCRQHLRDPERGRCGHRRRAEGDADAGASRHGWMPFRPRTSRHGRPTSSASSAWQAHERARLPMPSDSSGKAIDLDPKFALAYVGLADTSQAAG